MLIFLWPHGRTQNRFALLLADAPYLTKTRTSLDEAAGSVAEATFSRDAGTPMSVMVRITSWAWRRAVVWAI